MNAVGISTLFGRHLVTAFVLLVLAGWAPPNDAAQTSSSFVVSVTLRPAAESDTGLCRSTAGVGTVGATVTVVCATGSVTGIEAKALRFLTHTPREVLSGTLYSYAGVGTSTAFRVVSLEGREYVEMTVGW